MKSLLVALSFVFYACAHQVHETPRGPAATSYSGTEAEIRFEGKVEYVSEKRSGERFRAPTETEVRDHVVKQLMHLFGPMENGEAHGTLKAAPLSDPQDEGVVTNIRVYAKAGSENIFEIAYDYKGVIVVGKGSASSYKVLLPINPDVIFQSAMGNRSENPCTDSNYGSESDFWYFWSPAPAYPKCGLKPGKDYHVIQASMRRKAPGARWTYPEYERLIDNRVVEVHMLVGKYEAKHGDNPYTSKDAAAENFVKVNQALRDLGFQFRKWERKDFPREVIRLAPGQKIPHVEVAQVTYANGVTMRVRMFYGQTELWENNHRPFHYFYRDAIRNASVLIYDGHSGLGSHLDPEEIRKARGSRFKFDFNKERYQIFYLNSCSSYTYYNSQYLAGKRAPADPEGTRNLDMLLNGLSTDYDVESNLALIRGMDQYLKTGRGPTYQTLAERMDTGNLFIVIGDEDNPRRAD